MNRSIASLGGLSLAAMLFTSMSSQVSAGGLFEPIFSPAEFDPPNEIDNPYWPLTPGNVFLYFTEA